jgi:hypothetical protein
MVSWSLVVPLGNTKQLKGERESLCRGRQRRLVLRHIDALPGAVLDAFANLCARFAFARLLVRIKILSLANPTCRGVFAHITIEQAAMALAAVAVAIARLLIKNFLDARRQSVGILRNRLGEERRTQCCRQRSRRHRIVKRRNRFGIRVLRQTSGGPRRSLLRNQRQCDRHYQQNESAKKFLCFSHVWPPE